MTVSSAHAWPKQGEKPRSVADVIEELGFGRAQALWTFCAYGIWFAGSLGLGLGAVITVFVVNEYHFSPAQRASLSAFNFFGVILGTACGGPSGDLLGRRPPILLSYLFMFLAAIVTVLSSQFSVLAITRTFSGFAMGVGLPPCVALASEISPASHRIGVQAVRNLFYSIGLLTGGIIIICDNPYYQNMHWRTDMIIGSIPVLAMFVISAVLLRESPLILAKKGHSQEAHKILEEMKQLNGQPEIDTSYTSEADTLAPSTTSAQLTLGTQLKVIFGRRLVGSTVTLMFVSLTLNTVLYGHLYAFPLIATNEAASTMAPAYQTLVQGLVLIAINIIAIPISVLISRRALITLSLLLGASGMILFAWSGGILDRTGAQELCYIAAQNSPGVCATFGFIAVYQLSVDLYPVQVASTSAGLALLTGKAGGLVSPYLYEAFGVWSNFYTLLAAMSGLSLLMSLTLLRFTPWEGQGVESATENTSLLAKEKP